MERPTPLPDRHPHRLRTDLFGGNDLKRAPVSRVPAHQKNASRNLYCQLRTAQVTGRWPHSYQQLPASYRSVLALRYNDMPDTIVALGVAQDVKVRCRAMEDLYKYLTEYPEVDTVLLSFQNHARARTPVNRQLRERLADYPALNNLECFLHFGGVQEVVRVLIRLAEAVRKERYTDSTQQPLAGHEELDDFANRGIGILRTCCGSPYVASSLAANTDLAAALFTLVAEGLTFSNAVYLIEEMAADRHSLLHLATVPDLEAVVARLTPQQLAFFCRVFALVVFDPTEEPGDVLSAHPARLTLAQKEEVERSRQTVRSNVQLLAATKGLVKRLVATLACEDGSLDGPPDDSPLGPRAVPGASTVDIHSLITRLNRMLERVDLGVAGLTAGLEQLGLSGGSTSDRARAIWETFGRTHSMAPPCMAQGVEASEGECSGRIEGASQDTVAGRADGQGANSQSNESSEHVQEVLPSVEQLEDAIGRLVAMQVDMKHYRPDVQPPRTQDTAGESDCFKTLAFAFYQMEVLFVLCALLNSPHKEELQLELAQEGLSGVLMTLFGRFSWGVTLSTTDMAVSIPLHGAGCDCKPEASSKIQFLRMVHRFCDNTQDHRVKRLMLSLPDMARLRALADEFGLDADLQLEFGTVTRNHFQATGEGLLLRLVHVLVSEPPESDFRFWLATCIDTYLRGAPMADRLLLLETPLLPHLLSLILSQSGQLHNIQAAFDLLGELLKFNAVAFLAVDALLDDDEFNRLMEVALSNLVDSNVFLRSILLSLEYFVRLAYEPGHPLKARPAEGLPYTQGPRPTQALGSYVQLQTRHTRLGAYVGHTGHRVRMLSLLMGAVTVEEVTNENVCALNTALVFLMLEARAGTLPALMKGVRQLEGGASSSVLHNFRQLLVFWRSYYRDRAKEWTALVQSSRIPISEWWAVVDTLLGSGPDSVDAQLAPDPITA